MDPQHDKNKEDLAQDKAVELIRGKLDALYAEEPSAAEEIEEIEHLGKTTSKHQRYMKSLAGSGKGLAEIQTAWHEYYVNLSDVEKHEVWQEFYAEHDREKRQPITPSKETPQVTELPKRDTGSHPRNDQPKKDIKKQLLKKIPTQKKLRDSHHVRAMVFGVGMGALVVVILMFSFFNERFIAPFIRPSQNVSATPIIVDPNNSGPVGPEAKIVIPKINLEAPVIYDVPSIEEKDVQKGLENGVVHYITTPNPGEKGNSVIFGHSSSNILNKGKYKFAFILLKSLENGDTFIVQKDGKRYVYKVYNKFVTDPKDTSVLNSTDRPATMTLITCDPPGTSTNRLIVQAEQIFPDPSTNKESSATGSSSAPEKLPSNSPTLWYRITRVFSN